MVTSTRKKGYLKLTGKNKSVDGKKVKKPVAVVAVIVK